MKLFRLLVVVAPLLLTACDLSPQQKADYASVQRSGVSPAIYDKMVHGDALSLYDIETLSQARVSDGAILRYLRDRETVYYLGAKDVEDLRKAGVSQSIIDYMLETARNTSPVIYPTIGIGFGYYPDYGPFPYGGYWYGGHPHYHRWH